MQDKTNQNQRILRIQNQGQTPKEEKKPAPLQDHIRRWEGAKKRCVHVYDFSFPGDLN